MEYTRRNNDDYFQAIMSCGMIALKKDGALATPSLTATAYLLHVNTTYKTKSGAEFVLLAVLIRVYPSGGRESFFLCSDSKTVKTDKNLFWVSFAEGYYGVEMIEYCLESFFPGDSQQGFSQLLDWIMHMPAK